MLLTNLLTFVTFPAVISPLAHQADIATAGKRASVDTIRKQRIRCCALLQATMSRIANLRHPQGLSRLLEQQVLAHRRILAPINCNNQS